MAIVVTAPDGSTVSFADGTSEETINSVMMQHFAPKAENSLAGSGKALLSGLGEGVIGLAGFPAWAADIGSRGVDYLAGTKSNETIGPLAQRFGSEAIKKGVEQYTGEFYKPQTGLEKTISTVGSFGPAALVGPGGLARRVATQVVAPGVASEAAGQLAEGTGYEPLARVAGALGGAVAGSKLGAALSKPSVAAAPTRAEIGAATSAGYQGPAGQSLEIKPQYAVRTSDQIVNDLTGKKFSQKDADVATVYDLVAGLKNPEFGVNHTLADFDNTRRRLQDIAGKGGSGGEAARLAVRSIDAATLRIPASQVASWDRALAPTAGEAARMASKELFDARKNAAVGFRSDLMTGFLEKAANTAVATHSGGNLENEIYKQVRTALNNRKTVLRGWNDSEVAALRTVLPGAGARVVRRAGKLLGGGGGLGQMITGGAGGAMFGWPGMVALPAAGMGLNRLGSGWAQRRLQIVDELLRARSPLYSPAQLAQRQAALSGGGLLFGLPPQQQLALQGMLASRPTLGF